MKRILSIILASVMLFGCLVTGVSAEDIYLKLHVWAYEGSGIPENTDETRTDRHTSPDAYRAYVDNEDDFAKILERVRNSSMKNKNEDIVVLKIRYADKLTLEKFYSLYGYDELIKEYKEKYGEDLPKEDLLSYRSMYRAKIFPYHKAVAERDFEVKFDYISYELSYGFGYPGADVKVAGDKITFADVETLLKDERIESVSISAVGGGESYIDKESYTDWSSEPYVDVPLDAWYYEYVSSLSASHIFLGVSEAPKTFEPNSTLTRAMLVTVLMRHQNMLDLGKTETGSYEGRFTDVKDGKWYSEAVEWAAEKGVVEGYPDGSFRPNAPVTREETLTILERYYSANVPEGEGSEYILKLEYTPFADEKSVSDWAADALKLAMLTGAVDYSDDDDAFAFEPKRSVTRAEAAKIIDCILDRLDFDRALGYRTAFPENVTVK